MSNTSFQVLPGSKRAKYGDKSSILFIPLRSICTPPMDKKLQVVSLLKTFVFVLTLLY